MTIAAAKDELLTALAYLTAGNRIVEQLVDQLGIPEGQRSILYQVSLDVATARRWLEAIYQDIILDPDMGAPRLEE